MHPRGLPARPRVGMIHKVIISSRPCQPLGPPRNGAARPGRGNWLLCVPASPPGPFHLLSGGATSHAALFLYRCGAWQRSLRPRSGGESPGFHPGPGSPPRAAATCQPGTEAPVRGWPCACSFKTGCPPPGASAFSPCVSHTRKPHLLRWVRFVVPFLFF